MAKPPSLQDVASAAGLSPATVSRFLNRSLNLPPETAEGMLDMLMGGDAELVPLKRLLTDRTHGNPFFLEETVRSLVESQVLTGPPGTDEIKGWLKRRFGPERPVDAVLVDGLARIAASVAGSGEDRAVTLAAAIRRHFDPNLPAEAMADAGET